MEATTPRGLLRNGIERDDVLPGDPIRVRGHRLRDGSDGCLLGFVTPLHGDPERGHGIEQEWDQPSRVARRGRAAAAPAAPG
jgi:hypothetical protein